MFRLISVATGVIAMLLPMVISSCGLAFLFFLFGIGESWSLFTWIAISPLVYFSWLLCFITFGAFQMQTVPRWFPKQRKARAFVGGLETQTVLATVFCYRRAVVLYSLPLVTSLAQLPFFRTLLFLSYAPHCHIGKNSLIWGMLYDPDLTEIGDDVVIGRQVVISAHSLTTKPGEGYVYSSAPVRIGHRATIGGESRIAMGVTIGEDAIVEPASNVLGFTTIPAGEVWGGNPAVFRRKRLNLAEEENVEASGALPAFFTPQHKQVINRTVDESSANVGANDSLEGACKLVADALLLPLETVTSDSVAGDFPEWDSLGQFAIAAAVQDRSSIQMQPDMVFQIASVRDVARMMQGDAVNVSKPPSLSVDQQQPCENEFPLPKNPNFLPLLERADATRLLADGCHQAVPGKPLRVIVAASFSAAPMASSLKLWGRPFGFEVETEFFGFNQLQQALLDPSSPFRENREGLNVILLRPEDIPNAEAEAQAYLDDLLQSIRRFRNDAQCPLVVSSLPPAVSELYQGDRNWLDFVRANWRRQLGELQGVEILDLAAIVEEIGANRAAHLEFELATRTPYTQTVFQDLGISLVRIARKRHVPPVKVVAVDCDNTLWGGVIGEASLQGITLGADGEGRSFQAFQTALRHLKDLGVLLVLVSRNEPEDVWNVFDQHPGMILRREDIAASRINWKLKSDNLRELAVELNLGLDAFVFLDDDAAVRLEVETALPQVHVVPMPQEATHYCRVLSRLWLFDGTQATTADATRTAMMQEERERQALLETSTLENFLQKLDLTVEFHAADEQDLARVAQLTLRTNQFNTSLRRRNLDQIRMLGDQYSIYVLNARDRYGSYGQVGTCILRTIEGKATLEIDTFVLSCRALGRGIEQAFLYSVVQIAESRQATRIVASILKGPRNKPVFDFLRESGFSEVSKDLWEFDVSKGFELPQHIDYVSEVVHS